MKLEECPLGESLVTYVGADLGSSNFSSGSNRDLNIDVSAFGELLG